MKLTCQREPFLSIFQTAATVAPARSPKPILQNVKIDAQQEGVRLTATDMEIGACLDVPEVEVEVAGSAVIPVSRFGSILRESSDDQLSIESDSQGTIVKGQRSEFKLPSENPDEYPAIESFNEAAYYHVSSRVLKELIRRTLFATDTESSRYALGGILLEFESESLVAVGTDGRRLAKMSGPCQRVGEPVHSDAMTIVPTRSMQLIERALSEDDSEVHLAARANDILVRNQRGTIYSRLVEGRFPKWRDVFPDRSDSIKIEMNVGPLYSALRQASIFTSDESRGIDFIFEDGVLRMTITTADVGQSKVELPIPYQGDSFTITLDHRFMADFLKVLDAGKTFTLDVKDAESAALCVTDDGYGYVIMPLSRDRG